MFALIQTSPPLPPGHVRRVKQLLAHSLALAAQVVAARRVAHVEARAHRQLHRVLDPASICPVAEKQPAAQHFLQRRRDLPPVVQQSAGVVLDVLGQRLGVDEALQQPLGDESRRGRVLQNGVHRRFVVERPRARVLLAGEERLLAGVESILPEAPLAVVDLPPGEGARHLLDVLLLVLPHAEAEEFHNLAAVVLVRVALVAVVPVKPPQHRRLAADFDDKVSEAAQAVGAEQLDLVVHPIRPADLPGAGGKMVVPEERHPLLQRRGRVDHAVIPPFGHQVRAAADVVNPLGLLEESVKPADVALGVEREQILDGRVHSLLDGLLKLLGLRTERRPSKQMACLADGPGHLFGGLEVAKGVFGRLRSGRGRRVETGHGGNSGRRKAGVAA